MTDLTRVIEDSIRETVRSVPELSRSLSEAYVVSPKHYDIPTESLPDAVKGNHKKLYEDHVKALTALSAESDAAPRKGAATAGSEFRSMRIDEVYLLNAVHLHELFFANVGDVNSEILQDSLAYMRLSRDFGTFDDWQRDFMACAMAAREGWAVCGFNTFLRRYFNVIVDLHDQHIPVGFYPVLCVDMWTHSMDAGSDRKGYVVSMMRELNWEVIDNRFRRADKIGEALR